MKSRNAVLELLKNGNDGKFEFVRLQYLLKTAHPNDVTLHDIAIRLLAEEDIASRHVIEGMITPTTCPDENGRREHRYNRGGDHALFTGFYLSGLVYRYMTTRDIETLTRIAWAVDAIYRMTHITGTPGMLARLVMPLDIGIEKSDFLPGPGLNRRYFHIYFRDISQIRPGLEYLHNLVGGEKGIMKLPSSPIRKILTPDELWVGNYLYYTRTTRDQMTGVVYGLATAMYFLEPDRMDNFTGSMTSRELKMVEAIRETINQTAFDLYGYLDGHGWEMEDPLTPGRPGTSANDVNELLKLATQMLFRRALMNTYKAEFNLKSDEQRYDFIRKCEKEKGNENPSPNRLWEENMRILRERLQWFNEFKKLQKEDRELLPRGIRTGRSLEHLCTSASWFGLTWNYYAWNLRSVRISSILLLDDVHPNFRAIAPQDLWPVSTLEKESVNKRNRYWIAFFDRHIWKRMYRHGNPFLTYLYNFSRKTVLERHGGKTFREAMGERSIFSMTRKEFAEIIDKSGLPNYGLADLFYHQVPRGTAFGTGLQRAHFHLKSTAIWPIRSYASPCQKAPRAIAGHGMTQTYEPVYPPHLMGFSRFWLFQKDPTRPLARESDPVDTQGMSERSMLELPILFWLACFSGQLGFQFDGYESRWFKTLQSGQ